MSCSVLCIASSSKTRFLHGPSWAECVIIANAGRSARAVFIDLCLPAHRERDETITFSIGRKTPSNYAHKLTKPPIRWRGRYKTARRHGGCTSLPPRQASVAAATVPL
jgi:hypothetical protein